jgi:ABC-type spermidine/putrescine transport system permease subunit II/SAM-dependent methyltransferase
MPRALRIAVVLATALLILSPVGLVIYQSFLSGPFFQPASTFTTQAYEFVLFEEDDFREAFVNSAVIAAGMTAIAVPLGCIVAFLLVRTDLPGRRLIEPLVLVPMFVSSVVLAFGFVVALGPVGIVSLWVKGLVGAIPWYLYSKTSLILIAGLTHVPHVFLYASSALRSLGSDVEEAARSAGAGPVRVALTVSLPMIMPSILYASVLVFFLGFELFGLPLVLGDPERIIVLATYLYKLTNKLGTPDGRYALADLGAALLGNPGVAAMITHHAMLYDDLRDPVALLRREGGPTRLAAYWGYAGAADPAGLPDEATGPYSALMGASQALIAGDILDAWPLARHRRLLDIGGGEGAFAIAALRRHPQLRLTLFDLPPVAARARARFAAEGLAERAEAVGGSFHAGLPPGADAVSLVRVVHDHDDAPALALLRAAHAALAPGGTLLLAEPMAGTPGAEPVGDAYFGFYLLAMGSGRPRTAAELAGMLTRASFSAVREVPTRRPMLTRLLIAERPPEQRVSHSHV